MMSDGNVMQCVLTCLNVPDGACGVNTGCPQSLGVCLIPVKGCQGCTKLTVLVLQHTRC